MVNIFRQSIGEELTVKLYNLLLTLNDVGIVNWRTRFGDWILELFIYNVQALDENTIMFSIHGEEEQEYDIVQQFTVDGIIYDFDDADIIYVPQFTVDEITYNFDNVNIINVPGDINTIIRYFIGSNVEIDLL